MVGIVGECKIINIGPVPLIGGYNSQEIMLRDSGRYVIKGENDFIALSDKKTRTKPVSITIPASTPNIHVFEYDESPVATDHTFGSGEMFPNDLVTDFPVQELQLYGLVMMLDLSIASEPTDGIAMLNGAHVQVWMSRQPMTSWNDEDSINVTFSAYQSIAQCGITCQNDEGVRKLTTQKKLIPVFVPVKSQFMISKTKEKIYIYTKITIVGYQKASTAGGSIGGSSILSVSLVEGIGYLPEEVEELLSPAQ